MALRPGLPASHGFHEHASFFKFSFEMPVCFSVFVFFFSSQFEGGIRQLGFLLGLFQTIFGFTGRK
jgi:hypothetical protein